MAVTVILPRSLVVADPRARAAPPRWRRRPSPRRSTGSTSGRPALRDRLVDSGPAIRPHINVFVDGDRAALDTPLGPNATIHVIPGGVGRLGSSVRPGCGGRTSGCDKPPDAVDPRPARGSSSAREIGWRLDPGRTGAARGELIVAGAGRRSQTNQAALRKRDAQGHDRIVEASRTRTSWAQRQSLSLESSRSVADHVRSSRRRPCARGQPRRRSDAGPADRGSSS